jgi:hypothetical protein
MFRLESGIELHVGDDLVSRNGWVRLVLESDGDLVLYRTQVQRRLWASGTAGKGVDRVTMEANGDLVVGSPQGAEWRSGTDGNAGAHAVLGDDGNFVVYDNLENPLWSTDTIQDFHTPAIEIVDEDKYSYVETSESWKALCSQLPCFTALQWPGYATLVIDDEIDGENVVIQLWKGWCPQFLNSSTFPGGVGAEVGVYRRMPGGLRLRSLPLVPRSMRRWIRQRLGEFTDREFWWPFPELEAELEFTLVNPVTAEPVFSAGPETSYWLAKWMSLGSYARYALDQSGRVPMLVDSYVLEYTINGRPGRWPAD